MKFLFLVLAFMLNAEISLAAGEPVPTPPTPAPQIEQRAVEINFYGGLTGFDEAAYRTLKSSLALLLAEGVLDQFKTSFWGREGGSTFCVELGRDPKLKIDAVTSILGSIQPRYNSYYMYSTLEKCP